MEINSLYGQNININKLSKKLNIEKGDILRGKLVEILKNNITIKLTNGEYINGKTDISLNDFKGDILNFLVKSVDNKLIISPMLDSGNNENIKNISEDDFIRNVLKNNNIPLNKKNGDIIKSLLKFKLPINSTTIKNTINIANKLENLANINGNRQVKINPLSNEVFTSDIKDIISLSVDNNKVQYRPLTGSELIDIGGRSLNKNILSLEGGHDNINEGINNFKEGNNVLHIDTKDNIIESKISKLQDLITDKKISNLDSNLDDTLKTILPNNKVTSQVLKRIGFMMKNDIEISMEKLKFLTDIVEGKDFIEDDIKKMISNLENDKDIPKELRDKFKVNIKNLSSNMDKESIKNEIKELRDLTKNIKTILESNSDKSNKVNVDIDNINNKLQFLNELNNNSTFVYIPFKTDIKEVFNKIYVLNKKKNSKKIDNFKVYMSLNTETLKKVDIILETVNKDIKLTFNLENDKIIDYFKKNSEKIEKMLYAHNYNNVYTNYILKGDRDPIDMIEEDRFDNYIVDIKV
ncbi:hypothetical protein [Dethiothermospora halolimnae]|uniref:hypothetical protein n=1 Tax=Dethiothermospora halolimnae TaxID=3114390 RepID=UPI003CCC4178